MFRSIVVAVLGFVLSLSAAADGAAQQRPSAAEERAIVDRVEAFETALRLAHQQHLDPVDVDRATSAAIKAMMKSLDPQSDYWSLAEFKATFGAVKAEQAEVTVRRQGDFAYVSVKQLDERAAEDLTLAVVGLRSSGAPVRGLVLDLRGNEGGVLGEAVEMADVFLHDAEVVSQRGRAAGDIVRYRTKKGDASEGLPLAVLVNGRTAAGAEIVAAALQEHKRATLVGERTYGSTAIQTILPMRSGAAAGVLRLTTDRWSTPGGRVKPGEGLTPDIVVQGEDAQLEAALRALH